MASASEDSVRPTPRSAHAARNLRLMHPRNRYKHHPPDFGRLARLDPQFASYVSHHRGRPQIDWRCEAALAALTRALLRHDFGIEWELSAGRLCPTVPSRLNYLLWVADLVGSSDDGGTRAKQMSAATTAQSAVETDAAPSTMTAQRPVRCIDIGTGGSCIYPLLGVAALGWSFIATEVDAESVAAARHNVAVNGWSDRIEVRQVPHTVSSLEGDERGSEDNAADRVSASVHGSRGDDVDGEDEGCHPTPPPDGSKVHRDVHVGASEAAPLRNALEAAAPSCPSLTHPPTRTPPILCGVLLAGEEADVCVCNPPFYDEGEVARGRADLGGFRCTASRSEQFTPGGEVGFVSRLVADSLRLGGRVRWYTSLLGRKASLPPLRRLLRDQGVPHVCSAEMAQGITSRWVLAWSFLEPPAPAAVQLASAAAKPLARHAVRKAFDAPDVPPREALRRVLECLEQCDAVVEEASSVAAAVTGESLDALGSVCELVGTVPAGSAHGASGGAGLAATPGSSPLPADGRPVDDGAMPSNQQSAPPPACALDLGRKRPLGEEPAGNQSTAKRASGASPAASVAPFLLAFTLRITGTGPGKGEKPVQESACTQSRLEVELIIDRLAESSNAGSSIAAFWRFADRMRNDVVRDTRRWRRRKQRLQSELHNVEREP